MKFNIRNFDRSDRSYIANLHYMDMEYKYKDEIEECSKNTICYSAKNMTTRETITQIPNVIVTANDSVTELFERSNGTDKIAVLNFASYKNPGGQFLNGSPAQEEALCHNSTLYNILLRHKSDYYEPHLKTLNRALYTSELLYTPNVRFIDYDVHDNATKYTDIFIPKGVVFADVITCAAPNIGTYGRYNKISREELSKITSNILYERIGLILESAVINKVDKIILGAFGCGVFKNNPTQVASVFKDLIDTTYGSYFKEIIFPIPIGLHDKNNESFIRVLIQ